MKHREDLYRKQAIEAHFSSEHYQSPIRIITPRSWLFLIAIFVIFLGSLFWLFFGTVTTQVTGSGLIFSKNAKIVTVLSPEGDGYIEKISAFHGMKIKKGEKIADISYPTLGTEILEQRQFIDQETQKLNALQKQADLAIKQYFENTDKSIQSIQEVLTTAIKKRDYISEQLAVQKEALKKGIVSRLLVADYQVAFYNVENEIGNSQTQLVKLKQEKNDYAESWTVKIRAVEQKLRDLTFELQKKIDKNRAIKTITSPIDGIIFTNYIKVGGYVTKQEKVADIINFSSDFELIAFVTAQVAKKIQVGMSAKVFPKHIRAIEYGGIKGQVYFVGELPINQKTIETFFENPDLANNFLKQGPLIEVRIRFLPSNLTISGYEWTSSVGAPEKISIGSLADVEIIVKKEKPIAILVPTLQHISRELIQ
jgi:HlyD family secretion protein